MSEKIYKFLIVVIAIIIFGVVTSSALILYLSFDLPDVKKLAQYTPPVHSKILSRDGKILLSIGREKRELVPLKEIPSHVTNAFLASEDANFFEHHGIDYFGILRAVFADIRAGKIVQGGSTITQQVAKSVFLSHQKSFSRKFKDILLAQKIEQVYEKDEILSLYLNHVYFGGGNYGIKAAVKGHFNKELKDCTIAEAALLAGLLVAPSKYSPYVNPSFAKNRQRYVLGRMLETKKISKEEYDKAISEEIKIFVNKSNDYSFAGHFIDWIRQRVQELVGEEALLTNGITVVTTLDYDLQMDAESALKQGIGELDKRQGYKGPHRHLESTKDRDQFILSTRKTILESNSKYFTISNNSDKIYELNFNKTRSEELFKYEEKEKEHLKSIFQKQQNSNIHLGNTSFSLLNDPLHQILKTQKYQEALVEFVDDKQKLIYVNIAGIKGIIPWSYFKWAHKRKISEFSSLEYVTVNIPSEILKQGDVILIKIKDGPKPVWDYIDEKFRKSLKDDKSLVTLELKKQLFYICELDQNPEVEGALVAMNSSNGEIISMIGGNDFSKSQFNRATQSLRQPGSSFKPIIYASALENGYTPATIIIDSPEALAGADDHSVWKPKNYDGEFEGAITFRRSLERSRNVPTIKMALDIGVDKIIEFASRLGLETSSINKDLSLSLGTFGLGLLNLTSAYSVFPNGGNKIYPKSILSITDRYGKKYYLVEKSSPKNATPIPNSSETTQVYDPKNAYLMTNLLRGVIQSGTATSAKFLGPFVGGKTGTTNDYVDAWFIGFSNTVTAGVWTGFDNNETLGYGETGAKAALPIWQEFMKKVNAKYGSNEFPVPPGIVHLMIDKDTGKLASQSDGKPNAVYFMEAFIEGTGPSKGGFISVPINTTTTSPLAATPISKLNRDETSTNPSSVNKKSDIVDDDYFMSH